MIEGEVLVAARPVRILHLEDSELDAELVALHLGALGDGIERVWTRDAFVAALSRGGYDLILADHQLPTFDGDAALAVAREVARDIPFIFVSGTLGEDIAVEALKRGATDYVVKQRLERLPGVVARALAEAAERRERRAAQAALRASAARLQLALEAGRMAEVTFEVEHGHVRHGPAFAVLLGYPPQHRLTLDEVRAAYHPADAARVLGERAAILKNPAETHYDVEHRIVRPDGEVRWLYGRGQVLRDAAGAATEVIALYLDNSEKKQVEEVLRRINDELEIQVAERTAALAASEARMRSIFETSYQYQGLLTRDGVLIDANATSLAAIGRGLDEVIGKHYWETPWFTGTEGLPDRIQDACLAAAMGENVRAEMHMHLPGGWRIFDVSIRPMRDGAGAVVAIVPEAVDITERRQAEEALRQSQKLEAMGQLTGGVAHDFNNLLTPIIGSLDLITRQLAIDARQRRLVEGALKSAERARILVQRLLAFARRQPLQATPVDLTTLVRDMAGLIASTSGPRIKIDVYAAPDLPAAVADPNQLEMAILNLSVNARDAMPDGGRLTLAIDEAEAGELPPQLLPGRYLRMSVADTGDGMDAETLAKCIEPFFSTKGIGKGTGLGLSMVHGLASQLGGALTLASRPGLGTEAVLWLPVSEEAAGLRPAIPALASRRVAGSVLLVDDESLVRASTSDMLSEIGFSVTEADSAEAGLELIEAGMAFDLLITDHLMPGLSGSELAQRVRNVRPGLPILLISGFAEPQGVAADLPRLAKPFRREELAAALQQVCRELGTVN